MPVRVKPPPAETGEIISPGWAALAMTTPAKGARISMSSKSCRCTAKARSATTASWRSRCSRAATASTAKRLRSKSAWLTKKRLANPSLRAKSSCACLSSTSTSSRVRRAASSCDSASRNSVLGMLSSNRANSCPAATCTPSSINTSTTLPVALLLTVACRRATT